MRDIVCIRGQFFAHTVLDLYMLSQKGAVEARPARSWRLGEGVQYPSDVMSTCPGQGKSGKRKQNKLEGKS